jgi:hypothetical protein
MSSHCGSVDTLRMMEDGEKEQGGEILCGSLDRQEIQQRSVIPCLWFQSHYPQIFSLLLLSYHGKDSMNQNIP